MNYKLEEYIYELRSVRINDIDITVSMVRCQKIVRCKDCKYATDDDVDTTRFWCGYKWPAFAVPGDGYCFRGERKDG